MQESAAIELGRECQEYLALRGTLTKRTGCLLQLILVTFHFHSSPPTTQFRGGGGGRVRTLGTVEPGGSNSDSPEVAVKIPTGSLSLEKIENSALRLTSMVGDWWLGSWSLGSLYVRLT